AGLLGRKYDPLFIAQDPSAGDFRPLPEAAGELAERLEGRRGLLAEVDRRRRGWDGAAAVSDFGHFHQRAYRLLPAPAARRAFELDREPGSVRDRYGRSPFGQGCLLARRLVEAGVDLVTVNWARDDAFWDTHEDNFKDLKDR